MNILKDFDLEIIYALRAVLNTRTMSKAAPATETVASFYSLNSLSCGERWKQQAGAN